jgi:hypothetical protein
MNSRIMYIEDKSKGLSGPARIGRVSFSKRGKTIYYGGKSFQSLKGASARSKSNYVDTETGDEYWISGCKRDGSDRLYGERVPVEIDDDAREEYWTQIRGQPENKSKTVANL